MNWYVFLGKSLLTTTLLIVSFFSHSADQLLSTRWHEDGRVVSSNGRVLQLNLQSVYDGLEHENRTYVIGFLIDKDSINIPQVAEVSSDFSTVRYWTFENILSYAFIHRNSVHINDVDGTVFKLSGDAWLETNLSFPENSRVIFSDGLERLVACHPSSPLMTGKHRGGCFSVAPDWRYDFTWFVVTPKVCDGKLFIYENKMNGGVVRVLSLETGEALHSMALTKAPNDLCGVSGI